MCGSQVRHKPTPEFGVAQNTMGLTRQGRNLPKPGAPDPNEVTDNPTLQAVRGITSGLPVIRPLRRISTAVLQKACGEIAIKSVPVITRMSPQSVSKRVLFATRPKHLT